MLYLEVGLKRLHYSHLSADTRIACAEDMPRKRAASPTSQKEEDNKRLRSAIEQVADEYICPISQELPIDPVMAEDGQIYERTEIQRHIEQRADNLRSPMTNEAMGTKLLPSAQTRSMIRTLVRTGAIGGDKGQGGAVRYFP